LNADNEFLVNDVSKPGILKKLESKIFKVLIKNDRVNLLDRDYTIQHVYAHGFTRARITLDSIKINGELEYDHEPSTEIIDDVLVISYSNPPLIKHDYIENITISDNTLQGSSEPLSVKIDYENKYHVLINNKYSFKNEAVELTINNSEAVVNILIYPVRIIWLYVGKGSINLSVEYEKIIIHIDEV